MSLDIKKTFYILWLISYILRLAHSQTDLGCSKMLDTRTQDFCCGNNVLSRFMFMTSNCSKYWDHFDTCRYECLFKHWNLLDSEHKIKRPELYTMITQLYNPLNGFNSYGTAMKRAYETCDKLYAKYADFILIYSTQAEYQLQLDKDCEPFALFYALCVAGNMFMNCPMEYMINNLICNEYKTDLISCTKYLGLTAVLDEEPLKEPTLRNDAYEHRKRFVDRIMPVILLIFIVLSC